MIRLRGRLVLPIRGTTEHLSRVEGEDWSPPLVSHVGMPSPTVPLVQDQAAIDVRGGTETSVGHLGCGYWSEDGGGWQTDGMALGALGVDPDTSTTVMQCATCHLSAFASRGGSAAPQWNTANLFTDFRILAEVRNAELRGWVQTDFFARGYAALRVPDRVPHNASCFFAIAEQTYIPPFFADSNQQRELPSMHLLLHVVPTCSLSKQRNVACILTTTPTALPVVRALTVWGRKLGWAAFLGLCGGHPPRSCRLVCL